MKVIGFFHFVSSFRYMEECWVTIIEAFVHYGLRFGSLLTHITLDALEQIHSVEGQSEADGKLVVLFYYRSYLMVSDYHEMREVYCSFKYI